MPQPKYRLIGEVRKNLSLFNSRVNSLVLWILFFFVLLIYRNWEFFYLYIELFTINISSIESPIFNYSKYFVNTTHCRMPSAEIFSANVRNIYHPHKYKPCANDEPLVKVFYDVTKKKYILHIDTETFLTHFYANSSEAENQLSCCYSEILRTNKSDYAYKLLPCENFDQNFIVPEHIEFIIVECSQNSTIIQKDAFSFIQYKNNTGRPTSTTKRKPSVFLIGIDSLSRMNFPRTMPQTHQYLEDNNWFELQGYNKMGDNTFPNLMAVLNGNNETVAYRDCEPAKVGALDKCHYIWQDYQNLGYRTAYAEDMAIITTFNHLNGGFKNPPTEYYIHTMMLAIETKLAVERKDHLYYCIGRKHYSTYIYDYTLQFANCYKDEPTFGLFWTNSFSHDRFDAPATMDVNVLNHLKQLKSNGILENTIVIFLSDHGSRFGELRKLPSGFLEERLPIFYMSLPKWFKNQYPDFVRALQINRNRLTSPYDIHMTLNHILELGKPGLSLPIAKGCAKCQSIFREVPENRSCTDAGIPEHWCTCTPYETQSINNKVIIYITKQIIDRMNSYLKSKKLDIMCSKLKLKEIKTALLKVEENDRVTHNPTHRIRFIVDPKNANYEATIVYNLVNKTLELNVEDISCLTSYEKISKCTNDKQAKKYCICK